MGEPFIPRDIYLTFVSVHQGAFVLFRQFVGGRKDQRKGQESGDRIPLRSGDPRSMSMSGADL